MFNYSPLNVKRNIEKILEDRGFDNVTDEEIIEMCRERYIRLDIPYEMKCMIYIFYENKSLFQCNWDDIDKARVENYFEDFKLASRYAKQATSSLKSKLRSIKPELDRGVSIQEIIDDVIQPDIYDAPFVNYWEVGMSDGLIRYLWNNQTI